ncbi:uncharacterized protein LOC132039408 [Lycium ferocissimum]|uniref:uncharacterized protein LOC132039408 n=1 Tax=Lycium ferocissimum TaxID=112874 RepID=UPI00281508B4|nr:uncharacterized protein LOC132039408 [Lycium ferocissimum]
MDWTDDTSKKALIAWDKLCSAGVTAGLNMLDINMWNKAAICKLLWTLSKKKDKLWRIFEAQKYFEQAGYDAEDVFRLRCFSIKGMYSKLRVVMPKVDWRKLVCNNEGAPKWIFILYVAISRRLLTRTRLAKWGIVNEVKCPLCERMDEDVDPLLFGCPFSAAAWEKILQWQGSQRGSMAWQQEVQWATGNVIGRTDYAEIYRMALARSCVYHVWQERNWRIFQQRSRGTIEITRLIIQMGKGSKFTSKYGL